MIEKFAKALKFEEKEAAYFKYLVLFDQAKTAKEKQEYYVSLRSMENIKSEKALSPDQYDYFGNWYIPILRELVTMVDFRNDYALMARLIQPCIKPREAKKAVELLLRLQLIRQKSDGTYEQTDTAITAPSGVGPLAIRQFNKTMLSHAIGAIDTLPKTERNIFGITFGISPTMYDIICAEMAAFKDRIVTLVNRDQQSSRVFQLNLQLFPMSADTKALGGSREKRS